MRHPRSAGPTRHCWAKALAGPDRKKVTEAYEKEVTSLCDTILERVQKGDEDYNTTLEEAV